MLQEDDALIQEFLVESHENLDRLDNDFVNLEEDPTNRELLSSVFRTIHTIKGTAGFLAFEKLETLTHAAENLLSRLRDGDILLNQEITTALLTVVDAVRIMLAHVETSNNDGPQRYEDLIEQLKGIVERGGEAAPASSSEEAEASATPASSSAEAETSAAPADGDASDSSTEAASEPTEETDACDVTAAAETAGDVTGKAADAEDAPTGVAAPQTDPKSAASSPAGGETKSEGAHSNVADASVRVGVELLDQLMTLVSELVLARNQIVQHVGNDREASFLRATQRLNLITTELQEGVMKARMQPIGNAWGKLPRMVRDVSRACGKKVRLEQEGRDTELDRTILEAIKDPLTHIVRNAADHGIELPEERQAAGKEPEGTLRLRAFHEGGQVNIEIADDGKGIDAAKIREKAIRNGRITVDQADRMGERELMNLIFLPGLSTAETITNVSGRGVGMDVVKTNIEKIGGTVDLSSEVGRGTTIKIKIPLTLAIIPALIVNAGRDRYAIPQVGLKELVRLEGEGAESGIELVHDKPVYRLRGRLLPLIDLTSLLKVGEEKSEESKDEDPVVNIVVLQADNTQFGLVVDSVDDTEEIVVKPLGPQLKTLEVFAGAAIMGDGKVALILDVLGLAQHSGVVTDGHDAGVKDDADEKRGDREETQSLLLFRVGEDRRMATPLHEVARLEELPSNQVEIAGGHPAVQYRGEIMPLIYLDEMMGVGRSAADREIIPVVVTNRDGHSVGVVVDEILGVVEESLHINTEDAESGSSMLDSAVIEGRITDILSLQSMIEPEASSLRLMAA